VKVGFIGVGHMGKHMAACLMRAGHEVTINDIDPSAADDEVLAGARWASTPAEAARNSAVVVSSLPGPAQVDAVALGPDGVLAGLASGGLYIDMSTSTPEEARKIAEAAGPLGIGVLDAPVAGGMRGARNGTLTIMAGGSQEDFDAGLPVLQGMGEKIFLVGGVGAGHVAKLVNNMMTIVNGMVSMEAMVVGTKAGVDAHKLLEVVEAGTGASFALNVIRYVVLRRAFDPAKFATALAAKDLRLAVEFANDLGVPVDVVTSAAHTLAAASDNGLAKRDWSSYITLIENAAEVEVR
jgi:3-hydroxyisobutyrate dehydrogenase-like beta-hydroxyacid dehydrogenase